MSRHPIEYPLVDDPRTLADVIQRVSGAGLVAIDTEFVRERTYYPELCVLQLATNDMIAAIDCLAPTDLGPLMEALTAEDRPWLLHSARQDLEVLFYLSGKLPTRLIDTQIAAGLTGFPLQIGLKDLLEETIGVTIGKQHTRADWSRRPMPDAMVQYALDDVRHLLSLWHWLELRLEAMSRKAWFDEECERQLSLPIEPDLLSLAERTKGIGGLRGEQRSAAFALVAWREARAQKRNRPRRWILADDEIVRIARSRPETMSDLKRIDGLPSRLVSRSGQEILSAIRDAAPVDDVPDRDAPDRDAVRSLQKEVRARAEAVGIPPELLATRRDISLAAQGLPPKIMTTGWRRALLAELIED